VEEGGQIVPRAQIGEDWERWAALGYYQAEPLTRVAYTTYETEWVLDGLIYVETVVSETVDTDARTAAQVAGIDAALAALDASTVRPLRAVLAAQAGSMEPDPADLARLAELEEQAATLRAARAAVAELTTVEDVKAADQPVE
jgi:soluble lytic murein transglycosylase-like protein